MTFLPIVTRKLIEASRRRSTYWTRIGVALVALLIGGFVMLIARQAHPSEIGPVLFRCLAVLTYFYCALVGVFRTADCLSEEKREGTLGLLFLTDLKGYDIVVGKLVATSLNAVYGVFAVFPIMAVPVLAGGVAIDEVWRVALVSLNLMFFSLAIGMFCSAISHDERRAMVVAFLSLLFFTAGLPLLGLMIESWWRSARRLAEYLYIGSSAYPCFLAFAEVARAAGAKNFFVSSVVFTHVLSWVLLGLACFIVPRTWGDQALSAAATRRRAFWHRLAHGPTAGRLALRRRLLEINPVYWLAGRDRLKVFFVWAVLGLTGAIWGLGLFFNPSDWKHEVAYAFTAVILHTTLKIWLATEACRRFALDRQSGALELLLSTSLSVKEIVRGQARALERQFAGPALVVLLMDFVFLMAERQQAMWLYVIVSLMVVFVADLVTLAWVGMWRGLNSRHPNRAAAAVVARIMVLPWVLFIVLSMSLSMSIGSQSSGSWNEKTLVLFALAIALGIDLIFALAAMHRLLAEFRTVATTRFEKKG